MGLGRMKHVELRFLFANDLVKREKLSLCKVLGTENTAVLGKNVLDVASHRDLCHLVGLRPETHVVEEVKGDKRHLQIPLEVLGTRTMWKRLRTLLSRTGAMGTRKLDVDELGSVGGCRCRSGAS